jgi:hypothetical protein
VFVLLALTVPMSLALRVVTLVFFGGGALVFLASIATRRVALRVDASGVTLGGSPGRYGATTVLIPWADIREIVLWRQPMPHGRSMRYVGVTRGKGTRPLAGRRGQRAAKATARALTAGVSGDTLLASRAVNLWHLDTVRMAAAVAHFAPGVRVIDQDTGQVTGPPANPSSRPPVITRGELIPGHRARLCMATFLRCPTAAGPNGWICVLVTNLAG